MTTQWGWTFLVFAETITMIMMSGCPDDKRRHDIHAVMAVCAPGLLCALGNRLAPGIDWLLPYTLAFAVHFAIFEQTLLTNKQPGTPAIAIQSVAATLSSVVMLGTYAAIQWRTGRTIEPRMLGAAVLAILAAIDLFRRMQPGLGDCPRDAARWMRQAGLSTAGAVLAVAGAIA